MSSVPSDALVFFDAFNFALARHGLYPIAANQFPPELWADAAAEFLKVRQEWLIAAGALYLTATESWRDELKKYGRHLPGCPTGAPCNCGFVEIEKELAA